MGRQPEHDRRVGTVPPCPDGPVGAACALGAGVGAGLGAGIAAELPFLRGEVPPAFRRRTLTVAPGVAHPFRAAEWFDAVVVVTRGLLALECADGGERRFPAGAVLSLSGLALRAIRSAGPGAVELVSVARGTTPRLVAHADRPYVGVRDAVPGGTAPGAVLREHLPVLRAHVDRYGGVVAAAPFVRCHVEDRDSGMRVVEAGLPVVRALPAHGVVMPGVLPGGPYAVVRRPVPVGPGDVAAWAQEQRLRWAVERIDGISSWDGLVHRPVPGGGGIDLEVLVGSRPPVRPARERRRMMGARAPGPHTSATEDDGMANGTGDPVVDGIEPPPLRMVDLDGTTSCVRVDGDPDDPAILLIDLTIASWDEGFCARLASSGRHVIRYDLRDAGHSSAVDPAGPTYRLRDLVTDAVRLLDELDLERAHVVGNGVGGWIAQLLALDHPDRVATVTLIGTRPVPPGPVDPDLPEHDPDLMAWFGTVAPPDWTDRASVLAHAEELEAAFTGRGRPDVEGARARADRVFTHVESAPPGPVPAAALQEASHSGTVFAALDAGPRWRQRLGWMEVPTLVVHGETDRFFPIGNAYALSTEVPGSGLLVLPGAGHAVPSWELDRVAEAVLDLTELG